MEVLFRELETQCELDAFDTTKNYIGEILLYAALLSLVVSRDLLGLVTEHAEDGVVLLPERWTRDRKVATQLVLHELMGYFRCSPPPLLVWLIENAQKIHEERPIVQERLATTVQPTAEALLKITGINMDTTVP